MASIFEQTITPQLKFSNFPLHEFQLVTQNFGQLTPVYVREVYPNDVFTLSAFVNTEFAPMVAPMYHEVSASVHFFFVPDRVVFEDFETFITGSEDGHVLAEEDIPAEPGFPKSRFAVLSDMDVDSIQGSIFDYIGLPNQLAQSTSADKEVLSDLIYRGYARIWYEYYRDENLQTEFTYTPGEGDPITLSYFDFFRDWKRNSDICKTLEDKYSADVDCAS